MDYTGTFDGLAVDFATNKQKARLTLNEDARQAFENYRGKQIAITIKAYKKKEASMQTLTFMYWLERLQMRPGTARCT